MTSPLNVAQDVLVIGAGPAGALAATLLARAGRSVMLVDAKEFPRRKVCGGCLNARARAILERFDLASVVDEAHGASVERFHWVCRRNQATLPMAHTVAVDRAAFDDGLVRAAVASGARFAPSTTAQVLPQMGDVCRRVLLSRRGESAVVEAKLVICADGLSQSSLRRLAAFSSRVKPASRIGLAATIADDSSNYSGGTLTMAVSTGGYVGVARTGNGALNVAAAIDPRRATASTTPQEYLRGILQECRMPTPTGFEDACWLGTPALSRRSRRVAAERLFVLGDAAGYVEPFTGEGMSFAMQSAVLLFPLALRAIDTWDESYTACWERQVKKEVFAKQWTCRLLKRMLRSPTLCGLAVTLCRGLPAIPRRIMARLNRTPDFDRMAIPGQR